MKLLVDNSGYHLLNLGDVCMLQSGVRRLQELWPAAEIGVLTMSPERLASVVPGVRALSASGKHMLVGAGTMLPGLGRLLGAQAGRIEHNLRVTVPKLSRAWTSGLATLRGQPTGDYHELQTFMKSTDAVVALGGGFLTDSFHSHAISTLRLLELAMALGKPTAIFGQGIGPITCPDLEAMAARVLPRLDYVGLRESLTAMPLLQRYGVPESRIALTGDDAVETVFQHRATTLGDAVGLNVRVADYSGMRRDLAATACEVVSKVATAKGARILPVPISLHQADSDIRAIQDLLALKHEDTAGIHDSEDVIHQAGRCRVVVTGSYHGSIFALSQGVPVVTLVASDYYRSKFEGVANVFSVGCEVVVVEDGFEKRLEHILGKTWDAAPLLRGPLLDSARRQIAMGRAAYDAFGRIVMHRGAP